MISSEDLANKIRTDLQLLSQAPFIANKKFLDDFAKKILETRKNIPGLDAKGVECEGYYERRDLQFYYQLNPKGAKNPGALLVELGLIIEDYKNKNFSVWVKIPRKVTPDLQLKYRISIANFRATEDQKKIFRSIYDNERLFRERFRIHQGSFFPKLYPTHLFKEDAVVISKFYPKMDLLIQSQSPDFMKRSYQIFKDLAMKLYLLHLNDYVHLDIKPDNIFLKTDSNGDLRCLLGDLETLRPSKDLTLFEGTIPYTAPEVLLAKKNKKLLENPKAQDIWSLGCLLFFIASDRKLFMVELMSAYFPKKTHDWKSFNYPDFISEQAKPENKHKLEEKIQETIAAHTPKILHPLLNGLLNPEQRTRLSISNALILLGEIGQQKWSEAFIESESASPAAQKTPDAPVETPSQKGD
jgi:serine/threonine protein kinase